MCLLRVVHACLFLVVMLPSLSVHACAPVVLVFCFMYTCATCARAHARDRLAFLLCLVPRGCHGEPGSGGSSVALACCCMFCCVYTIPGVSQAYLFVRGLSEIEYPCQGPRRFHEPRACGSKCRVSEAAVQGNTLIVWMISPSCCCVLCT